MQEDIPPATTNPNDHTALANLWAQKVFTKEELCILPDSSLDIDTEEKYDALMKRLNAINRQMFNVYRLLTFLVHANNSHKHPARTLITEASVARDELPPSARIFMGELEKQEARKAERLSARKSNRGEGLGS